jgi:uncharacterized protein
MTEPPKIEFPCDYPLWIIGERQSGFEDAVLAIVRRWVSQVHEQTVTVRESRAGAFCSVRVTIVATGEEELKALHGALMAEPAVRMVL